MSGLTIFGIRLTWDGKAATEGARQVVEETKRIRPAFTEAEAGVRHYYDSFGMLRSEAVKTSEVVALSAKQQAFALRQVPMQFTDIVTSLASGQAPMMVLLQQGGQLKDTFGGIGPAVRALGGYVAGLINPLTLSAAAAAGIGVAFLQAEAESAALRRSVIMTGEAIGATYSGLRSAADQAAESTGKTRAAAAGVVASLAASGRVAVSEMGRITDTVLRLDSVGAQAIDDSVKHFVELGKAPVEASIKLNEQFHYLTESTYKQIKALQDQGREEEAAALAQRTYDQAMSERADKIEQSLGVIKRAWIATGNAAAAAWDSMLGIGREDSLEQKLAKARGQLEALGRIQLGFELPSNLRDTLGLGPSLAETIKSLEGQVAAEEKIASATAAATKQREAGISWDRQGEQVAGNRLKRENEIARARQLAIDAGITDNKLIQARIDLINKKYADPKPAKPEKTDREKAGGLIAQYERENQLTLEKLARASELALMSERDRAITEAQYKAEDQANSMRERVISSLKSEAEEKKALLAIDERLAAQKDKIAEYTAAAFDSSRSFETGWNRSMQQFADDATNYAKVAQTSVNSFVDGSANAMANWAVGRKANFADVFTSLMAYMIKVQLMAAASQFLSGMFGSGNVSGTPYTSASPTGPGTYNVGGSEMTITALPNAHGNVFSNTPSLSQYSNSILTGPTFFQAGQLHAFANGGVMNGVAGEAGLEAVMPLTRVGPDLGVRAMINVSGQQNNAMPKVIINTYNNASGAQAESRQSTNANGDIQIDTFILDTVKGGMAKGYFDTTLQSTHNLKRAGS